MARDSSFEALRETLEALDVPAGDARRLQWVVEGALGAAKTSSGDFEVFVLGEPLTAQSAIVRRHLEHGAWQPTHGAPTFIATRIVLPAAPHYAPLAALIAVELARAGIEEGAAAQRAFDEVEPIVELAIRRGSLTDEALLGLFSELLVLLTLLRAHDWSPEAKAILLGGWRGWQPGRDFVFGRMAIEVKATRGGASTHAFSGLHQLEEQPLPDGEQETLHVLSLGLQDALEGGQTLPGLVDELLAEVGARLEGEDAPSPNQAQLLAWIEQYGDAPRGYRHLSMREWPQYQTRLTLSFAPRLYRIRDEAMRLLPRATVEETFLRADSLTFQVAFPAQVSAFNPSPNWQADLVTLASAMISDGSQA